MKRSWFLLSVGVLAGCATLVGPPGTRGEGSVTLTLQPTVVEGRYRTQALVKALTAADIEHVVVSLSKVEGTEVVPVLLGGSPLKRDIPAKSLSLPVAFRGLPRNTTFRILARAYRAAGEDAGDLISLDASSVIDLAVREDDRPLFDSRLPIQLRDTQFSGVATGSFAIGNGSIVSGGAESIVSEEVDLPTPEPTPSAVPSAPLDSVAP
jgi:hypothetical protein